MAPKAKPLLKPTGTTTEKKVSALKQIDDFIGESELPAG